MKKENNFDFKSFVMYYNKEIERKSWKNEERFNVF